jgi:hypothetical protein
MHNVKLYLKLHSVSDTLLLQLKSFLNRADKTEVDLLLCRREEDHRNPVYNLELLKNSIDLLFQKNNVNCSYITLTDRIGINGWNWMIADDFFVQFNDDLSNGMMTRDPEWISFFQERYQLFQSNSERMYKSGFQPLDFLIDYMEFGHKYEFTVLEYMPSLAMGLTKEILEHDFYPDIPDRKKMIDDINTKFLLPDSEGIQALTSFFDKRGLEKFMATGKLDAFPYSIYYPMDMKERCIVLENVIRRIEQNDNIHYYALNEGYFQLEGIRIDSRKPETENLRIEIHLIEENEQILVSDPQMKEKFRMYLECLKDSSFVYEEEETLQYMKQVLDKFQKIC